MFHEVMCGGVKLSLYPILIHFYIFKIYTIGSATWNTNVSLNGRFWHYNKSIFTAVLTSYHGWMESL